MRVGPRCCTEIDAGLCAEFGLRYNPDHAPTTFAIMEQHDISKRGGGGGGGGIRLGQRRDQQQVCTARWCHAVETVPNQQHFDAHAWS